MGKTLKRAKKKASLNPCTQIKGEGKRIRRRNREPTAASTHTNRVSTAFAAGQWSEAVEVCARVCGLVSAHECVFACCLLAFV